MPPPRRGHVTECGRCGCVLAGRATGLVAAPLALTMAALLLLLPACVAPLMIVNTYGSVRMSWLPSGVVAMWTDGFPSLAVVVGTFSIALPAIFMGLLIWVLGSLREGRGESFGPVFRWVQILRPWVMIEVFLIGCFVAYSRIKVISTVDVGVGGWCLIAATLVLMVALTQLDERTVWEAAPLRKGARRAAEGEPTIACSVCDFLAMRTARRQRCPRCHARLHLRKPDSMRRTTALVVAGYALYIPANTLPVLIIVRFGREDNNTILSGVMELIHNHLWPLAVIVFAASIVLPLVKLFGLTWMLIATARGSRRHLTGRTRFYRIIDLVGRWSNIDVFMVSVLAAVLQFGAVTSVHAGDGLVAFAAVVLLTMIATEAFDSRLMWDLRERHA